MTSTESVDSGSGAVEVLSPLEQQWLDQEREAFLAAQDGEHDRAIEAWTDLFADERAVAFFRAEEGIFEEAVRGLARSHESKGDIEGARAVAAEWGVELDSDGPAS